MTHLVADTSGLVSLGCCAVPDPDPLQLCLRGYDVLVPETVVEELREVASYDDAHGDAATSILDQLEAVAVRDVELDATFPLDDGENATVTLANEVDAGLVLCDEFNQLGLIHASLAGPRLVTTPTLLAVLVRREMLQAEAALDVLDSISTARSWDANSYVQRARTLFSDSSPSNG